MAAVAIPITVCSFQGTYMLTVQSFALPSWEKDKWKDY